jgi:hypothetical protein
MVDALKPNQYPYEVKLKWLSDIDATIVRELIDTHENSPLEGPFVAYTDCDADRSLIAPHPYDILYRWYLESQIDLGNMEIGKYNNTRSLFNTAYQTYTDYYNRTHLPKQRGCFRFTEVH